jgi:hypothetical protein
VLRQVTCIQVTTGANTAVQQPAGVTRKSTPHATQTGEPYRQRGKQPTSMYLSKTRRQNSWFGVSHSVLRSSQSIPQVATCFRMHNCLWACTLRSINSVIVRIVNKEFNPAAARITTPQHGTTCTASTITRIERLHRGTGARSCESVGASTHRHMQQVIKASLCTSVHNNTVLSLCITHHAQCTCQTRCSLINHALPNVVKTVAMLLEAVQTHSNATSV